MGKSRATGPPADMPDSKRARRATQEDSNLEEHMEELTSIQNELCSLDVECAKEQMKVQMEFTKKMRPFFEKRKEVISKIPKFWAQVLDRCPYMCSQCPEDMKITEHLKHIDLEDAIDEKGSYRLTLEFDEGVKEFFEPTTLVKEIRVTETGDNETTPVEEVVECTEIVWKPEKEPRLAIAERRKKEGDGFEQWSIFDWFKKKTEEDNGMNANFGEIIRQDVFLNPLSWLVAEEDTSDEGSEKESDGGASDQSGS